MIAHVAAERAEGGTPRGGGGPPDPGRGGDVGRCGRVARTGSQARCGDHDTPRPGSVCVFGRFEAPSPSFLAL
jgi:hypothetical protein